MPFPESDALKGSITSLKEIVSRSQSENVEIVNLISQIESTVTEIERKSGKAQQQAFVPNVSVTPVVVL